MAFIDLISSEMPNWPGFKREICISNSNDKILEKQLQLIEINLGSYYNKYNKTIYKNNKRWQSNKWQEMCSENLFHVSYWNVESNELVCFCSIMPCEESIVEGEMSNIIYLYEIHVAPEWRNQKFGKSILNALKEKLCPKAHLSGIELTVFSSNERAINFYRNNGFTLSYDSPSDKRRRTRTGIRIIRPTYYIMCYVLR
ncbi:hypothetical protein ZYGR_0E00880 [Zygosaccharomyces rouxii]|nr:hypothetical protein ZYGR_0E00880 [Zygosaccharomyces rouxii]